MQSELIAFDDIRLCRSHRTDTSRDSGKASPIVLPVSCPSAIIRPVYMTISHFRALSILSSAERHSGSSSSSLSRKTRYSPTVASIPRCLAKNCPRLSWLIICILPSSAAQRPSIASLSSVEPSFTITSSQSENRCAFTESIQDLRKRAELYVGTMILNSTSHSSASDRYSLPPASICFKACISVISPLYFLR